MKGHAHGKKLAIEQGDKMFSSFIGNHLTSRLQRRLLHRSMMVDRGWKDIDLHVFRYCLDPLGPSHNADMAFEGEREQKFRS